MPPSGTNTRRPQRRGDNAVRVLTSFPRPRSTTNPYIVQLSEALEGEPGVDLQHFGWRSALGGGYDVVHLHWPETWLQGATPLKRLLRLLATVLLCVRWTVLRTPVVRTFHNLERPEGLWRVDYVVLAWLEHLTRVYIRLNDQTDLPPRGSQVTIPHGHYRDWFARFPQGEASPGRVAFVGRIRRYKGVEHLLDVFRRLPDPSLSLTVAGLPSSQDLVEVVETLAGDDPRISLRLEYVDEATLAEVVTSSSLVVLPYRHMHNSGSVLAALSLDRPVLVPANDVNRALREEVGDDWVHLYAGDLTTERLQECLEAVTPAPAGRPDLSAREWHDAGTLHLSAYRVALGTGSDRP